VPLPPVAENVDVAIPVEQVRNATSRECADTFDANVAEWLDAAPVLLTTGRDCARE
jgi:hypothetical protein